MRFEIRTGGTILILIGLLVLSGAVFALGLVSGYEMARQNTPDSTQLSSVFPVPSPPAVAATPAVAPEALSSPAAAPSVAALAAPVARPSIPQAIPTHAPIAVSTRAPLAVSTRAPVSMSTPAPIAMPTRAPLAPEVAAAEPTTAMPRHPYNIQIDAVMDRAAADDMVRRLKALGFPSTEIAAPMNGLTLYRVRVGPYATEEEAKAAEAKLHAQYRATYRGN